MSDRTFREAVKDNIEMISGSDVFVNLFNPSMADFEDDPLPAIQLAIAILLDKPIVLAVLRGREGSIPAKLLAIADHVIVGGAEELATGVQKWVEDQR